MRELSPTLQLHRLDDGLWWAVTLHQLHWRRELGIGPDDDVVLRAGLSKLPRAVLYGRPRVVGIGKRQLSSREIERHGLR